MWDTYMRLKCNGLKLADIIKNKEEIKERRKKRKLSIKSKIHKIKRNKIKNLK
jgi:hypothetical protein